MKVHDYIDAIQWDSTTNAPRTVPDVGSYTRGENEDTNDDLYNIMPLNGKLTLSQDLGIENLFDRFYDPPLGGAYVGQGTTMTIPPKPNQPQWGTPVPGPGRSVYAGVKVRF